MRDLSKEWKMLGDTPIDDDENIEEEFLHFPPKTNRIEIWRWFDENDMNGVAHLMGIRSDDE